jgi:TPR repeat protein
VKKINFMMILVFLTFGWAMAQTETAKDKAEPPQAEPAKAELEEENEHAILLQRAESGDVEAQYRLGMMYYIGSLIPQDYEEAAKWLQMAAERGNIDAQFRYGCLLYYGRGVEQDFVQSHMWFNLAAAADFQGSKAANEYREMVAKKMSEKEISEAQALAKKWAPKIQ